MVMMFVMGIFIGIITTLIIQTINKTLHYFNDINKHVSTEDDYYNDDTYIIVGWPDSQTYMDEPWFEEEAILIENIKYGPSAYMIPLKYLNKRDG